MTKALASLLSILLPAGPALAAPSAVERPSAYESYRKVVAATVAMTANQAAQRLAKRHGLDIVNVAWEDVGRYKDSAVGANITDMTIQVAQADPRTEQRRLDLMPVIRFPDFADKTADLSLDEFFVLTGNEKGRPPVKTPLRQVLSDPRRHLSQPGSWKGRHASLLAPRDTKVLVSAQACFLPVPKQGLAEFNPAVFNYQSYPGDPAVLTLLATREGTSVTVVDNERDAVDGGYGQRLFFNKDGERAAFTGQRLSDFKGDAAGASASAAGQQGLNMVLLIQVPLKQKHPREYGLKGGGVMEEMALAPAAMASGARSDVEAAVIGHGKVQGPFTEVDGLDIERDERYPIRVTVQFYKATSNGVVSESDMAELAAQIHKVYDRSDYVGSLVVCAETGRVTEHSGPKVEPEGWWQRFLDDHPGWRRARR